MWDLGSVSAEVPSLPWRRFPCLTKREHSEYVSKHMSRMRGETGSNVEQLAGLDLFPLFHGGCTVVPVYLWKTPFFDLVEHLPDMRAKKQLGRSREWFPMQIGNPHHR